MGTADLSPIFPKAQIAMRTSLSLFLSFCSRIDTRAGTALLSASFPRASMTFSRTRRLSSFSLFMREYSAVLSPIFPNASMISGLISAESSLKSLIITGTASVI